jgi:HK97 family phage major capsid protein
MPKEGAEIEAHQEIFRKTQEYPNGSAALGQGLLLPSNMSSGTRKGVVGSKQRDSLAGDYVTGGALISPQFFPTIDLLRNMPALARAGATFLGGLMGDAVFPRQEGPTTGQSVAEGAALLEYDQAFGQVRMTPHRVGTFQRYSRLMLLQPTYDFAAMVMRDHLAVIALYIDEMGLNGSGGQDQPLGIMNQPGIGTVTFGGSASTAYQKIIAMETAIRKANIYDEVSFVTTSVARGTLRVTPATLTGSTVVSGASQAIWTSVNGEEECVGRPAVDTQQVVGDRILALVGRYVILGQWGGLAIVLDTLSRAEYDEYKLSINTYIDVALRHAQAVAVSSDSLASLT